MKHFFYVVFGGIGIMALTVVIWFTATFLWNKFVVVKNNSISLQSFNNTSSAITSVSGFYKNVNYTADQEEDIINSAALSLPNSDIKSISAKGYVVKNLTNSTISAEKNSEVIFPIASVTKLVTAVVASRLIAPDTKITITKNEIDTYGNTGDLIAGETFKASNLLYPLLMVSSNDAAEALAQSFGRVRFIQAMNDFVQSIGAYRTSFSDPSGLNPRNVSTAKDLAIILDWIYKYDKNIIDITKLKSYTVRNHNWISPTHFLSWSYYAGGKNGYTIAAMNTAASLFTLGSKKDLFAIVLLGTNGRDTDMIKLLKQAEK